MLTSLVGSIRIMAIQKNHVKKQGNEVMQFEGCIWDNRYASLIPFLYYPIFPIWSYIFEMKKSLILHHSNLSNMLTAEGWHWNQQLITSEKLSKGAPWPCQHPTKHVNNLHATREYEELPRIQPFWYSYIFSGPHFLYSQSFWRCSNPRVPWCTFCTSQ